MRQRSCKLFIHQLEQIRSDGYRNVDIFGRLVSRHNSRTRFEALDIFSPKTHRCWNFTAHFPVLSSKREELPPISWCASIESTFSSIFDSWKLDSYTRISRLHQQCTCVRAPAIHVYIRYLSSARLSPSITVTYHFSKWLFSPHEFTLLLLSSKSLSARTYIINNYVWLACMQTDVDATDGSRTYNR